MSQTNAVNLPSCFSKIHFNIVLPSTPRCTRWTISVRFPHQNPVCTSPPDAPHSLPTAPSFIWPPQKVCEQYKSRNSALCSFSPVTFLWAVQIAKLSTVQFFPSIIFVSSTNRETPHCAVFPQSPVTASFMDPNISLRVRDQQQANTAP